MFLPSLLSETDESALWTLMQNNPLASLVIARDTGVEANHLPAECDRDARLLRMHVSRSNPIWSERPDHIETPLAIFHGANHYISPTWQPGFQTHGKVAPSWNYAVVHALGKMRFIDSPDWLRNHLEALAAPHETRNGWHLRDTPDTFVSTLLPRIIGIEIDIRALSGKSQACQQYNAATRDGVIEGLNAQNTDAARDVADLVRQSAP